ncbi:hypothetical protein [Streptomyces xanthochromogenes]|uniref:Uncharacterized protein n=1 Tax=Streptomyces xanthochromogenes TaxID=67384 RepID=A0ABQ3AXS8_9ACTN|nr:hypothetical protein [Streptomyces xanthochromogenes]GGY70226.1 hypothetical protein GCM10010326_75610 [Streptomyces xanthochromogenes]
MRTTAKQLSTDLPWVDVRQQVDVVRDLAAEQADGQKFVDLRGRPGSPRGVEHGLPEVGIERCSGLLLRVVKGIADHLVGAQEAAELMETIAGRGHSEYLV